MHQYILATLCHSETAQTARAYQLIKLILQLLFITTALQSNWGIHTPLSLSLLTSTFPCKHTGQLPTPSSSPSSLPSSSSEFFHPVFLAEMRWGDTEEILGEKRYFFAIFVSRSWCLGSSPSQRFANYCMLSQWVLSPVLSRNEATGSLEMSDILKEGNSWNSLKQMILQSLLKKLSSFKKSSMTISLIFNAGIYEISLKSLYYLIIET